MRGQTESTRTKRATKTGTKMGDQTEESQKGDWGKRGLRAAKDTTGQEETGGFSQGQGVETSPFKPATSQQRVGLGLW